MLKAFAKDSLLYSLSSWCSRFIGIIMLPYYTHIFSPTDYGIIALLAIVVDIGLLLISAQMDQSVARYYMTSNSKQEKHSIATTGLLHYLIGFSVAVFLGILFRQTICHYVLDLNRSVEVQAYFYALLFLFIKSIMYYNINMLKWLNLSKLMTGLSVLDICLSVVFVVLFTRHNKSMPGIFIGQALGSLIVLILSFRWLKKIYVFSSISKATWLKLFKFSFPLVPVVALIYFVQYIDRFIILRLLGVRALGIFSLGYRLSSVVYLLLGGFQLAWGPFIYNHYKSPETKSVIAELFLLLLVGASVFVVGASLFSYDILNLFTTPAYYAAYSIIPILIANSFLLSLIGYFSMGINIAEKNYHRILINSFGLLFNILLNYLLIPRFGVEGAAFATFISFTVVFLISVKVSNLYYRVVYPIKKSIFLVLLTFGIAAFNLHVFGTKLGFEWILKQIGCIIVYLAFCFAMIRPSYRKLKAYV